MNDTPARVLALSYWNLNDPAFGGGIRIMALLQALGPRATLCQPRPAHPTITSEPFPHDWGRRKRGGINWGMFNAFIPANRRAIRRAIRKIQPALIVHTSMWTHAATRGMNGLPPMVLDAHDVNAMAIAERYGNRHWITRMVQRWERETVRAMQHVFACSPNDQENFIRLYGLAPDRVTVVPNGVFVDEPRGDAAALPMETERAIGGRRPLLFLGKLDYQPNREALDFLSDRVLPALERAAPGRFCVVVVGGPVPAASFHPAMIFAGRVPSVDPWIQRAAMCLAPIFSGSGTRLKILEYMAAGKPVIATPKGAEGIEAQHGRDLWLAEPESFADAILHLERDPQLARHCAEAGRDLVFRKYSWKASQALWTGVMGQWLGRATPGQG